MTRILLADTFDPSKLQGVQQITASVNASIKNANDLLNDFERNLKKVGGVSFADLKSQMEAVAAGIKEQGASVEALAIVHNKIKILQTQELLLSQNLTKEARQTLIVEKQKLEAVNKLLAVGYTIDAVGKAQLKTTKDQLKEQGAEFVSLDSLSKKAQERVKLDSEKVSLAEKYVEVNGEMIRISESELKNSAENQKLKKENIKNSAMAAASAVGVQFSLGGIIKKLIDAYDQSARLGAMSKQITNQWSGGNSQLDIMNQKIMDLSYGFKISADQAGAYLKQLSYSGMGGDTGRFSEEILAREQITGQGIESQFTALKEVRTEYGKTTEAASGFLNAVFAAKEEIPYLSMDEVQSDILAMGRNMQAFNGNMLGAVGTYKVLLRDSAALKSTGLGDLSQSMRREFASTLSSMSTNMPLGMKAFFGMRMPGGAATPAAGVFKYERSGDTESGGSLLKQFTEVAKILKTSAETSGMGKDQRILAIRDLLGESGFTNQALIMRIAPLIESGLATGKHMQDLLKDQEKSTPNWSALTTTQTNLATYISDGQRLATAMKGSLEIIELYITNILTDMFRHMTSLLKGIRDWFWKPEISAYEAASDPKKAGTQAAITTIEDLAKWKTTGLGEDKEAKNIRAFPLWSNEKRIAMDAMARGEAPTDRYGALIGKNEAEAYKVAEKLLTSESTGLELKRAGIDNINKVIQHALAATGTAAREETQRHMAAGDYEGAYEHLLETLRKEQLLKEQAQLDKDKSGTFQRVN